MQRESGYARKESLAGDEHSYYPACLPRKGKNTGESGSGGRVTHLPLFLAVKGGVPKIKKEDSTARKLCGSCGRGLTAPAKDPEREKKTKLNTLN